MEMAEILRLKSDDDDHDHDDADADAAAADDDDEFPAIVASWNSEARRRERHQVARGSDRD
jgi:hypothetical protein